MQEKIVIDATNAILGRLASFAAKQALQGKRVIILNSEKALISGNKATILMNYRKKRSRVGSSQKGPRFHSPSERILKRTIRGMLSHKKGKGRDALKRVRCYKGIPEQFKAEKRIISGKEKESDLLTIDELSKRLKER